MKIAIALGSGSARGWAHIGVLKALDDMGIKPTVITGCSIGAVVGAAYAMGRLDELEKWACKLTRNKILRLFDISIFKGGLLKGTKVSDALWGEYGDINIEDMPLQFATVATDINSGSEVWLDKGDLATAVRASFSLPGFFSPVQIGDRWLIDGGITNPVPVSLCRAMGADKIIGVNLNKDILTRRVSKRHQRMSTSKSLFKQIYSKSKGIFPLSNEKYNEKQGQEGGSSKQKKSEAKGAPTGYFDVMASSINIMQYRITNSRLAGDVPDIIIEPYLSKLDLFDFDRAEEAIEEGYASVQRAASTLEYIFK